ncbi:MAG: nucleotidyltransferase domain-containing protein [Spirochaetota bacterium]
MNSNLLNTVTNVLHTNEHVVFAYLLGSAVNSDMYNDIDIAVYVINYKDPFTITSDLKYELYTQTGIPADTFDIRIINDIPVKGDLFALLYLKDVFEKGLLLVDKSPYIHSDFLECYSLKYRECEGLFAEVLS